MDKDRLMLLLSEILDCGIIDLSIMDGCKYDFGDVLKGASDSGDSFDINELCRAMFNLGKDDMVNNINKRISRLDSNPNLTKEKIEELACLQQLNPYEDIESYHNYSDTSIYVRTDISGRDVLYEKYCKREFKMFEEMTGFSILT